MTILGQIVHDDALLETYRYYDHNFFYYEVDSVFCRLVLTYDQ